MLLSVSPTALAYFNGSNAGMFGGLLEEGGNLIGATTGGGQYGYGSIFEVAAAGGPVTTLASFNGPNGTGPNGTAADGLASDGAAPNGNLVADSSGNLFGTTFAGGAYGNGTVFEVALNSGAVTTLASFSADRSQGANPHSSVVVDSQDNLFGTTYGGGEHGNGSVFELAAGNHAITTVASFDGTNGENPVAGVIEDSQGNLFGTTPGGPNLSSGTVFKVAVGSGTITTLVHNIGPSGGLAEDSNGDLFGTIGSAGTDWGDIFEVAAGSGVATIITSFRRPHYENADAAGVVVDSHGNLFGAIPYEAGVDGSVFEVAAGSSSITTLAQIDASDGATPTGGVIVDDQGNVFGLASNTGTPGNLTVFEVATGSGAITSLASINTRSPFGAGPAGGLVEDNNGNFFGMTSGGGQYGDGTVFELAAGSDTVTTIASFDGINDGSAPRGSLTIDNSDNLFGTTFSGGPSGDGTVFEVAAGSNTITTLAAFSGDNGNFVQGDLVDSEGNLYGVTSLGGINDWGTVFEVMPGSQTVTTLASFNTQYNPNPGIVVDGQGDVFGTSQYGGQNNSGTLFEVVAGSRTVSPLVSFINYPGPNANGGFPEGGLIEDSNGNLYGTTSQGGPSFNGTTVFELPHGSSAITTLAEVGGAVFGGTLTRDTNGDLFGIANGVFGGNGWVFEIAAGSETYSTPAGFSGTNGFSPSNLVLDGNGNLIGTAQSGPYGAGMVFEIPVIAAGALTPPSVSAGQAFQDTAVFQFSGLDSNSADYTAVVTLGDGNTVTLNSNGVANGPGITNAPSASGQIVPDSDGGFDVQLSYTYAGALSNQTFGVVVADNDGNSTSASTSTFGVGINPTTTSLQASPVMAITGQPMTLTATVAVNAPGSGTPDGCVTFSDASGPLGVATLHRDSNDPNATAILTLPDVTFPAGTYSITATYNGVANVFGGSSAVLPVGTNTVTLTACPAVSSWYQPVTFTATVADATDGDTTPTGSVDFFDTATQTDLGQAALAPETDANGNPVPGTALATLTVQRLGAGYRPDRRAVGRGKLLGRSRLRGQQRPQCERGAGQRHYDFVAGHVYGRDQRSAGHPHGQRRCRFPGQRRAHARNGRLHCLRRRRAKDLHLSQRAARYHSVCGGPFDDPHRFLHRRREQPDTRHGHVHRHCNLQRRHFQWRPEHRVRRQQRRAGNSAHDHYSGGKWQ